MLGIVIPLAIVYAVFNYSGITFGSASEMCGTCTFLKHIDGYELPIPSGKLTVRELENHHV